MANLIRIRFLSGHMIFLPLENSGHCHIEYQTYSYISRFSLSSRTWIGLSLNEFEWFWMEVYSTQVFNFKILEKIFDDAIIMNYGFLRIFTDFLTIPQKLPFLCVRMIIFIRKSFICKTEISQLLEGSICGLLWK